MRSTTLLAGSAVSSRYRLLFAGICAGIALLGAVELCIGPARLSLEEVLAALAGQGSPASAAIVWNLRLPRVLIALVAGAALGLAGALLQHGYASRLASPELNGISAGAVLAIVAGILAGRVHEQSGIALVLLALAGGLAPAALMAWLHGRPGARRRALALAGWLLALGLLGIALVLLVREIAINRIVWWVFGSLEARGWVQWGALWPWALLFVLAGCASTWLVPGRGERTLGLAIALALVAGATAAVGPVGFIGLFAPRLAHRRAGDDTRQLFPLSAIIGAALLIGADLAARLLTLALPSLGIIGELPAGLVTLVVGLPLFLVLLRRDPAREVA